MAVNRTLEGLVTSGLTVALVLGAAGGLGSAGCRAVDAREAAAPAEVAPQRYDQAFAQTLATLRDLGFVVDRQDHRFGQITTQPKLSPTVFEPWKPDHTYLDQAGRATLGSLRRSARVSFAPSAESNTTARPDTASDPAARSYRLEVEVLVERLQVPTRRLSGTTRGSVFQDLSEIPAELQQRGITGRYWQPVGRDPHLEARLRRQILDRLDTAS